jgi:hypothetical protein
MARAIRILALLGLGLALGVLAGLYFGWQVWPTEFTDAGVGLLDETYQREYAVMVAQTYGVEGDLARAESRLQQLDPADPGGRLRSLTVDMILEGEPEADLRVLVRLAADLGVTSPAMAPYLPVEETPEAGNG